MQNEKDLGRDIFVAAFTLKGGRCPACPGKIARLTQEVIEAIEMDTAGLEPAVWFYPTGDGRGGLGFTFVQPITTSFLTWDVWPDHGGAYLQITSCKTFSISLVQWIVGWHFHVIDVVDHAMSLGGEA